MTDYPILFSAPMVRALLDGRKTLTRRMAWREAKAPAHLHDDPSDPTVPTPTIWQKVKPGDRLWCREAWQPASDGDDQPSVYFRATDAGNGQPWRPSIHMPRWASRITLTVTATKMGRVQEISEEDAIAEGLLSQEGDGGGPGAGYKWSGTGYHGAGYDRHGQPTFHTPKPGSSRCSCNVGGPTPAQCAFAELWRSLHTKPGATWEDNPEVCAISFECHQRNIDQMEQAA